MQIKLAFLTVSACGLLLGCAAAPVPPPAPDTATPLAPGSPVEITNDGRCFAQTAPRTTTRIVTEQVEVVPAVRASDGTVTTPAVFRDQARPITEVIAPGTRFATLCPVELTQERIATLQRALKARLAYSGPITGEYDAATRAAVQAFQAPQGFDSPEIARSLAQSLGLVPFGNEATNAFAR